MGNSPAWLTEAHVCEAEFIECVRIIAVQRDCSLRFNPRLGQTVLTAAQHGHCQMCHRMVRNTRENFGKQSLDLGLILRQGITPSFE